MLYHHDYYDSYHACAVLARLHERVALPDRGVGLVAGAVGPWGCIFSKNCSKSNDNPKGKNFGRNFGSAFLQGLGQNFG